MAAIEYIYQLFLKTQRVFTDSRQTENGGIFFALKGDSFDGNDYVEKALADGASYAVSDRKDFEGNDRVIVVDDVLSTLQELANFHRKQLKIPVLAITGTNGKTTTKELITHVLKQKYNVLSTTGNLNNHIGVPLTLLGIRADHEIAVVEMGANHPGEIEFLCSIAEPDYGIITNVGMAHLEGFGSFDGVKRTKGELYQSIANSGKGIFINSGNEHLLSMAPGSVEKFTYSVSGREAQLTGEVVNCDLWLVCRVLFPKGWLYIKTNLTGVYNLENVLAACRIGLFFGIDPILIQKGIESYMPSNNRSQVLQAGGSKIISDCYNANPSSMEASIRNFMQLEQKNKTLILGDMLELGEDSEREHQKIVELVYDAGFENVYWVGANFQKADMPAEAKKFKDADELLSSIKPEDLADRFILIKGSRGIKLEKVLELLK
ncbi:MAG TPA: UDP-N-acetylmuramoyl-tripeptide--D-alanyl-D-alanine ligase [Prolixibacteraceae bacterium]|nr:UDP-N-acetylmuramoyl-tripeptide--D-alanyl-D-alanine ligase [Prolixibacteraceae bacterium]